MTHYTLRYMLYTWEYNNQWHNWSKPTTLDQQQYLEYMKGIPAWRVACS